MKGHVCICVYAKPITQPLFRLVKKKFTSSLCFNMMKPKEFYLRFVFGLSLAFAFIATACQAMAETVGRKPNVVVFLVDDLGWSDTACYGAENYETPNVDRLARQGMRFTNAYAAAAVCSPPRASIMSGKYPARLHLTDFISGHVKPYAKLKVPHWTAYLPLEEVTLAEAMKEGGYETFFAGKWHLGDNPKYFPQHQGFDTNLGGTGAGAPWTGYFSPYHNRRLQDGPKGEYLTDRLGDESVAFLDNIGDRPFFLYLSFYSVHTPIMGKPELVKYFQEAHGMEGTGAEYAAMIFNVDQNIGKVLEKLDTLGLSKDTLVIFTSDNGGIFRNEPLRRGKGTPYEGGIREPLIVRYPGRVPAGSESAEPVTSTDLYPTILEIAGLPLRPAQHADGLSLGPLLAQKGGLDREAIFWHYPHYHAAPPYGVVRKGDWKLIQFYEKMNVELYNLKEDISESHDLADSMPEPRGELVKLLDQWRESIGAQMPTPNPDFDPARQDEKAKGPQRKAWLEANVNLK